MIGNKESYIPEGNSPILADSGFVHTDDIVYNPDTKTVTCEKSTSGFNSQIYSKSGYKDSLFISFKPSQITTYIVFGLDENPSANAGADNFTASWYLAPSGQLYILEGGVQITPATAYSTYDTNTELRIEYNGGNIKYYHNGVLVRSFARPIGSALYMDSSFYSSGGIYDLNFGIGLSNETSGYAHTSDITYNPDTKTVTCSKSGLNWTSQIYSKSGYVDNVFVTFKPVDKNMYFMIGLNANPSESSSFTDIDYCWFCQGGGSLYIFESGTQITPPAGHTTYSGGDELRIEYSGGYVRYYHNGELVRSVARAIGNPLYLDSSFYNSGSVYDVEFGTGFGCSKVKWTTVNANLKYAELNGVVYVMVDFPQASGENDTNLGTLPAEYLPEAYIYQTCFYRPSNGMTANIFIPINGQLVAVTNNTSSALLRGIVSYPKKGIL